MRSVIILKNDKACFDIYASLYVNKKGLTHEDSVQVFSTYSTLHANFTSVRQRNIQTFGYMVQNRLII